MDTHAEIYDEFYTSCDGEHRAMLDKYIANAGTLKYVGDESAKELVIKFLYEFGGAKWIIKPVYETVSKASVEFDGEAAHFMSADLYAERGYAK